MTAIRAGCASRRAHGPANGRRRGRPCGAAPVALDRPRPRRARSRTTRECWGARTRYPRETSTHVSSWGVGACDPYRPPCGASTIAARSPAPGGGGGRPGRRRRRPRARPGRSSPGPGLRPWLVSDPRRAVFDGTNLGWVLVSGRRDDDPAAPTESADTVVVARRQKTGSPRSGARHTSSPPRRLTMERTASFRASAIVGSIATSQWAGLSPARRIWGCRGGPSGCGRSSPRAPRGSARRSPARPGCRCRRGGVCGRRATTPAARRSPAAPASSLGFPPRTATS